MNIQPTHITFLHGLGNKPAPGDLERAWLCALSQDRDSGPGFHLASSEVTTSFVYWADLFYDAPADASQYESTATGVDPLSPLLGLGQHKPANASWMHQVRNRYELELEPDVSRAPAAPATPTSSTEELEGIPLIPDETKKHLLEEFLVEAHHYLFDVEGLAQKIIARVLKDLGSVDEETRHVIVGHSLGSVIAYDVLANVNACKPIQGFLTLGSPLGIEEIQEVVTASYPKALDGPWWNVYDSLDLVSRVQPRLADTFKTGCQAPVDVREQNWGRWRHSATKYFRGPKLRHYLRELCHRRLDG